MNASPPEHSSETLTPLQYFSGTAGRLFQKFPLPFNLAPQMSNWYFNNVSGKGKGRALLDWQRNSFNVEIENLKAELATKETVIQVRPKLSLGWRKRGQVALKKVRKLRGGLRTQNPEGHASKDPTPKAQLGRKLGPEPTRVCPGATPFMVAEVLNSSGLTSGDAPCPAQQDADARILPSVPVARSHSKGDASHPDRPPQNARLSECKGPGNGDGSNGDNEAGALDNSPAFFSQRLTQQLGQAQADRVMETLPANKRYAYGNPWVVPDVSSVLGVVGASRALEKGAHWDAQEGENGTDRQDEGRERTQEPHRERTREPQWEGTHQSIWERTRGPHGDRTQEPHGERTQEPYRERTREPLSQSLREKTPQPKWEESREPKWEGTQGPRQKGPDASSAGGMEARRIMMMRAMPMDVDPIEAPQEPLGAIIPYEPRPLAEPIEDTSSGELMQPTSAPLAMSFEAQYIAEATREVLAPVVDRLSSQVGSLEARQHVLERLSGTVDRAIPEIEGQIGQASQGIQNLGQNTQEALTKAGVQMEAMGQHLDEVHTRAKEAVGNLDARLQKVERQVKRNHEALDEWELQYYAAHGSEQMNHDAHGSIIQQMGFLFERCTKMEKWAADQVTKGHSDAQFSSEMEELFDRLEHLENEHQKYRQVAQYLQATIKGWPSFGQISGGL